MLHYKGHTVSFQEVPDEVSLVILIGDCPHRCPGCHSPELWTQSGISVKDKLDELIAQYVDAITCVCFMGEGQDDQDLLWCADHARGLGFKTAIYSGYLDAHVFYYPHFDYYKCGSWKQDRGGLDNPDSNQFMMKLIVDPETGRHYLTDITSRFYHSV